MSRLYHAASPGPKGSGIHVFIAIPVSGGLMQCPPIHALLQAIPVLEREGIAWDVFIEAGNCHVDDARNSAVREFMKTSCTDLFFIDADVGFAPEAIARLLKFDRDLVAGVYPKKTDDEDFPVTVADGVELWSEADGLVEVVGAPTGFMRIRRNLLEAMCEKYKHRRYSGQKAGPDDPPYTILFERTYENGRRFSGDYAFCNKWRAMGGKIYVDPELPFTHEGLKEWGGVLGDYWRRKYGVDDANYIAAVQRLRDGDSSPDVFVSLFRGWNNPWAATPAMLQAVYHMAMRAKGPILECGSGITTLVLAIAAEKTGHVAVSLESDAGWLARVTTELRRFDLASDVRFSPITDYTDFKWYQKPKIGPVSMVVCDGPARTYGRQGLFALLGEEIKGAAIIMDDTDDKAQAEILSGWAEKNGYSVQGFERFSICNHKPLLRVA